MIRFFVLFLALLAVTSDLYAGNRSRHKVVRRTATPLQIDSRQDAVLRISLANAEGRSYRRVLASSPPPCLDTSVVSNLLATRYTAIGLINLEESELLKETGDISADQAQLVSTIRQTAQASYESGHFTCPGTWGVLFQAPLHAIRNFFEHVDSLHRLNAHGFSDSFSQFFPTKTLDPDEMRDIFIKTASHMPRGVGMEVEMNWQTSLLLFSTMLDEAEALFLSARSLMPFSYLIGQRKRSPGSIGALIRRYGVEGLQMEENLLKGRLAMDLAREEDAEARKQLWAAYAVDLEEAKKQFQQETRARKEEVRTALNDQKEKAVERQRQNAAEAVRKAAANRERERATKSATPAPPAPAPQPSRAESYNNWIFRTEQDSTTARAKRDAQAQLAREAKKKAKKGEREGAGAPVGKPAPHKEEEAGLAREFLYIGSNHFQTFEEIMTRKYNRGPEPIFNLIRNALGGHVNESRSGSRVLISLRDFTSGQIRTQAMVGEVIHVPHGEHKGHFRPRSTKEVCELLERAGYTLDTVLRK